MLFLIQAELFPYRYGGMGILHRLVRGVLHAWEDLGWSGGRHCS